MDPENISRKCRLIRLLLASEPWKDYFLPLLESRISAIEKQLPQRATPEETDRLRTEHMVLTSLVGRPAADLAALMGTRGEKEDD